MEENTKFRNDLKKEQEESKREVTKMEKELDKVVGQLKGEKKFLEDRIKTM